MSLKAFHIFFIATSTLVAFGFGVWGIYIHFVEYNAGYLIMGVLSLIGSVVLVIYGIRFLRRFKHVGYL